MDRNENIIYTEDLPYTIEPGGLGKIFFERMKSYGDAIAQMNGYTGETETYNSLLQRCVRAAIHMRSRGIVQGDIISICSYNHFDNVIPFLASFFIGAVSANLDPSLPLSDTIGLIKQVKPKMIFTGTEALHLIENSLKTSSLKTEVIVFGKSEKYIEFRKFLETCNEEENFSPIEVNMQDTAIICFSSGTSGYPKGICLTHLGIFCQGMRSRDIGFNLEGFLGFSSFYWVTAIYTWSSCILHKGFKIVVPTFHLNKVWGVLSKVKVSSMIIPTYLVTLMCKKGRPKGIQTNLEYLAVNGSYMTVQLAKDLKKILPETKLVAGYGLTEAVGYCFCFMPNSSTDQDLYKRKPDSDGRALAGFTLKVVDPDTEEILGPHQQGELRIQSKVLMNGYYNMDSSSAWDSEGWLKTGDIVYYDEDKCFYVIDRLKEIMRVIGYTVLPAPIEKILAEYPGVEFAVVVGKPHPDDEEHPVGVVVLENTFANEITAQDIEKYVEERVHESKRLRGGVKIVQSLPITPTGKINRYKIKRMIAEGTM